MFFDIFQGENLEKYKKTNGFSDIFQGENLEKM